MDLIQWVVVLNISLTVLLGAAYFYQLVYLLIGLVGKARKRPGRG